LGRYQHQLVAQLKFDPRFKGNGQAAIVLSSAMMFQLGCDDLLTWLSRDLLGAAVDRGVAVRAPASNINYIAGCDASGGRNDGFTAAISRRDVTVK
jgi:hypothetical protein